MAKKKGNKNSGSNASVAGASDTASTVTETTGVEEVLDVKPEVDIKQEDSGAVGVPTTDGGDLQAQLEIARQEIANLKAELAKKDAEIESLKQSSSGSAAAAPSVPLTSNTELQKLQERLKQLRKEQQEADAAKDAAWKQLKAVIGEISKLATPVTASIAHTSIAPVSQTSA